MLASSSQTPDINSRGKRKWTSNERLNREEEESVPTDSLQTPQSKRARRGNTHQEARTPFGKVSVWVKETARKTVQFFHSFREKFWRDEVEDQENEICLVVHESTEMQKHRHFEKDDLYSTQVQDEESPSPWRRKPLQENLSQYRHYEPSSTRRTVYNPSKYSNKKTTTVFTDLRPTTLFRRTEDQFCGSDGEVPVKKYDIREIKPKPQKSQNVAPYKVKRHPTTVDNVVRLHEREQYMKLLAHYTPCIRPNYGSISRSPILVEDENEKDVVVPSKRTSQPKHSVLSSQISYNRRLPSAQKELRQPVALKVQPSPSKMTSSASETSGTVSASSVKGILELQPTKRPSRRSFDLLDDTWIKKWRETLSTEYLEQERKIAKEKLKLEAIRKEKDDFELISQQVKDRMHGKRESSVIEEEVPTFQELTDEMNVIVDNALGDGASNELLVELPIGRITRGDIVTLRPQTWLNDEVVNAYFHMISERSKNSGPKVHTFNTFFYPKLMKTGHASLKRWTKKVDLFAMDIVLIPIHLGMHWCLAVIDIKRKTFTYYDSLKGDNPACIQALRDYICAESLDKKKTSLDLTGWKNDSPKNIPEQLNGCDCGVFACKYGEYASRRATLNFTQHHMPYFRRSMVYEILKKKLL